MTHLTEEQLVLHYYGESGEPMAAEEHLRACQECRAEYAAMQRLLNTVDALPVPERGAEYGDAVWRKLQGRVEFRRPARRFAFFPRLAFVGAMAAMVLLAFLAGRWSQRPERPSMARDNGPIRERVLLVALGEHLDRSQRVLVELSNAELSAGGETRQVAESLLADNRLYRQAALREREAGLVSVLDELERLLANVANASEEDLQDIRARMADEGILFKVRVVESNVRQRGRQQLPVMRY